MIVRVPSKEYHHIARACDMGAEGLMLPMVGSAAEAHRIVDSIKYTPDGRRGVALQVAHDRYRPGTVADKFNAANRRTTVFCQIETAEGVDNAEAIAALPGVDCLWVGHFDLSVSLGVPGQFDSKTFNDAIDRVVAAAKQHEKSLGRLVRPSSRGSSSTRRASTSSVIPATFGCCTTRWTRLAAARLRAAWPGRDEAMTAPFRVALSGDFRKPDGSPIYPDFDLAPLRTRAGVEVEFLEPSNPIRAEQIADFDALILLAPRFAGESIHPNGRLAVVARFGVGYDTVEVEACTNAGIAVVITPDGVRRPVAVAIMTLMLALTGRLMVKDRLTREGGGRFQPPRRAHGFRARRTDARLDRHRQYRRGTVPAGPALRHAFHCATTPMSTRSSLRSSASSWSAWRMSFAAPTSLPSAVR